MNKRIQKRLRILVFGLTLAGGTVFNMGSCIEDWVGKALERQQCVDEYGHKPDFVEQMCF